MFIALALLFNSQPRSKMSAENPKDSPQSADQNPATSENAFLNLQSKRPTRVSPKGETGRARPSDITVTEPTYLNYKDAMQPETVSGSLRQAAMTPRRSSSPFASPNFTRASASPRHLSPATSQIFERDVKEPILAPELSPAIPSHIQTDDHIPPVLDASSEVITNKGMDVDEVEVVTHTMHQPAALTVVNSTHGGESQPTVHGAPESQLGVPIQEANDENNTNYGTVDPMDPRRLSFISWADVVHGEQVDTGKESASHLMSPSSAGLSQVSGRSPSPVRSLRSDRAPLSPPMSGGRDASPSSRGPGSVSSGQGNPQHSEITVQTMRETLQKTGSNDAVPEFRTE